MVSNCRNGDSVELGQLTGRRENHDAAGELFNATTTTIQSCASVDAVCSWMLPGLFLEFAILGRGSHMTWPVF